MAGERNSSLSLKELLSAELELEPCQCERRPVVAEATPTTSSTSERFCEVDCLVHEEWLSKAVLGEPLSRHPPPFSHEEVHWHLQPSCSSDPPSCWKKIHICCLAKPQLSAAAAASPRGLLVARNDGYAANSVHTFLTHVCQETLLSSWKELTTKLSRENGGVSRTGPPPLTSTLMSQLVSALYGMELHHLSSSSSSSSSSPSSSSTSTTAVKSDSQLKSSSISSLSSNKQTDGLENLSPLLSALETDNAFYLIYEYQRFTLFDIVIHSPAILEGSSNKPLFVVYQLLKLLSYCHSRGVTLGDLNLRNIYIDSRLWVQCCLQPSTLSSSLSSPSSKGDKTDSSPLDTSSPSSQKACLKNTSLLQKSSDILADYAPPSLGLADAVQKWRSGYLSNFDYLMLLNYHAGRRLGDPNNHPIFPWVMDFSERNGVLRDLSSSKHRIVKGDRQLEFTYQSALEDVIGGLGGEQVLVPHHIGEIASDVTYYVYLARQTPKEVLCSRVRPRWVPEEYPASIEKMYHWTPDECIPEFFTNPKIFTSIHPDLPDLVVPSWCSSPQELVNVHRQILESDSVSSNLHNWIDLVFGYKLSGEAAVKAKNVYLSLVDGHTTPTNSGIVQLFRSAHPKRLNGSSAPLLLTQWESQLGLSTLMNITSFDISQQQHLVPSDSAGKQQDGASPNNETDGHTLSTLLNNQGGYLSYGLQRSNHDIDDGSFEHVNYPTDFEMSPNISEGELSVSLHAESSTDPSAGILGGPSGSKAGGPSTTAKSQSDSTQAPLDTSGVTFLRRFRGRRPNVGEQDSYYWKGASIAAPNEAQPIQTLAQLEEFSHFLSKSCRNGGSESLQQWTPADLLLLQTQDNQSLPAKIPLLLRLIEEEGYFPTFEDRVSLDLAAVACTAVEMCCSKYLRSAIPYNASLQRRYQIIQKLLKIGQIAVPCSLENLTDVVFHPSERVSSGDLSSSFLPSLSANVLTQQFLPLMPFPTYFEPLYAFLSDVQKRSSHHNGSNNALESGDRSPSSDDSKSNNDNGIITFLSERIESLLNNLDQEGLKLLLMYLVPLYQKESTCFQAAFVLTDSLAMHLAQRKIQQVFTSSFIHMFDLFGDPANRCGILSRWMAEKVISWFGLSLFLTRFLPCILESVIEPLARATLSMKATASSQAKSNSILASVEEFSNGSMVSQKRLSASVVVGHAYPAQVSLNYNWNDRGFNGSDSESEDSDNEMGSLLANNNMSSMFAYLSETDQKTSSVDVSDVDSLGDGSGRKTTGPSSSQDGSDSTWETIPPSQFLSLPPSQPLADSFTSSTSSSYSNVPAGSSQHEDSLTASEAPPSPTPPPTPTPTHPSSSPPKPHPKITRFMSMPGRLKIATEVSADEDIFEEREELDEDKGRRESEDIEEALADHKAVPTDPKTREISARVSNVASDCVSWLVWRLGPILSTKHIVGPLLENLYRCFTGVCGARENACARNVLRCLAAPLEYYGERMITKLYLPIAKSQVAPLVKRSTISLKAEASVAASLTLLAMCIEKTSNTVLLQSYVEDVCSNYLDPLFQLLSSPKHIFPSGTAARLIICNSAVDLLKRIAEKVGRDTSEALMKTLQGFFECFSTAHNKQTDAPLPFPIEEHFGQDEENLEESATTGRKEQANLVVEEDTQLADDDDEDIDSEGKKQVVATFSRALVHVAYIDLCKIVGQIRLNNKLRNADVIEELHASFSQKNEEPQSSSLLSSLLCLTQPAKDNTEDINSLDSDSPSELNRSRRSKIHDAQEGKDYFSFGRSSFFVEPATAPFQQSMSVPGATYSPSAGNKISGTPHSATLPGSNRTSTHVSFAEAGRSHRSDSHDGVPDSVRAGLFDTKFGASVAPLTRDRAQTFCSNGFTGDLDRHLKGNWADLWDHSFEGGVNIYPEPYSNFQSLKLQSFLGHKSSIRSLCVLNSEHMFLSSSKDKTVKIWSLHNQGGGSMSCSPRLSYNQHQRPVTAVSCVSSLQKVVSCDGSIHLWDMETGTSLYQFSRQTQYSTMAILPDHPSMIVAGTADFHLQFLDLRTKSPQYIWRTHFPTGGSIRFLTCTGGWVAVGNTSGMLNTLDLRTGEMIGFWRPSEKWPYAQSTWTEGLQQLKVTMRGNLLTSAGGGMISLWKHSGRPICHLQGQSTSTPCLEIFGEQLVSVSSGGNTVVHSSYELMGDCPTTSVKIRGKEVRSITCSANLPLNQLLLLGSEGGNIVLMA